MGSFLPRSGRPLDSSKHGVWSLTEKGFKAILTPEESRQLFQKWVRIFQEQRKLKDKNEPAAEQVAEGTGDVSKDYRHEVLDVLLALPSTGFERLSQRLLREAGFTQVVVTGQSGDGGIDGFGILQVNPLVSFKVLFQCKRYAKSVAPSQVRDFRGAMSGRADKGIFITTGTFTAEAKREATRDGAPPVELIDGEKLIDMLENWNSALRQSPHSKLSMPSSTSSRPNLPIETDLRERASPLASAAHWRRSAWFRMERVCA